MILYINIFFWGLLLGILLTIATSRTIEKGSKPRLENWIHYLFRSESYSRTKIMDDLISTVKWEIYHIETENGKKVKICGVFANATNIEIGNIILEFRLLDEEGVLVSAEENIEYGNTLPGEKRRLSILFDEKEFSTFNVIAKTNSFADIPHFR